MRPVVDVLAAVLSLRPVMGGTVKQWLALGLLTFVVGSGGGCDRLGGGPGAEEREANYIAGQNLRVQGQQVRAIASFEQALLVNPANASAHLALADLFFDQREFINAAYHYSRHQQLLERRGQKPDSSVAGRLEACELKLALQYSQKLGRQQTDTEIEALRRQIAEKDSTIQRLQAEVLQHSSGTNPAPNEATTAARPKTATDTSPPREPAVTPSTPNRPAESTRTVPVEKPRPSSPTAVHLVRAGETPAAIARKHGISVKALLAANPGLNPNRMRVGMELKLPAP